MDYTAIYKKAEIHVTELFQQTTDPKLVYHNLQHTQKVVASTKEIAGHYQLISTDEFVLYTAAWFHDTGYLNGESAGHEERSVQLMQTFMKNLEADDLVVNNIGDCILATKSGVVPVNLLQQIIVDADTYNFGTKEFAITNKQVYKEYVLTHGHISKQEWNQDTLKLLERHQLLYLLLQGPVV